jgi:hypothetical protein
MRRIDVTRDDDDAITARDADAKDATDGSGGAARRVAEEGCRLCDLM